MMFAKQNNFVGRLMRKTLKDILSMRLLLEKRSYITFKYKYIHLNINIPSIKMKIYVHTWLSDF